MTGTTNQGKQIKKYDIATPTTAKLRNKYCIQAL